ncbi:MAG: Gldg family protein [bacterium]|nr:Gldg family protein [bacterium]
MKTNKQQNPWVRVVLLAAIFIVANLVMYRLFFRVDLTANNVYTLAKASKNAVATLDKKMVVKCYFTPNLPAPYNQNAKFLRDLLDDYQAYGKGKFEYQFVDPGTEEKLEKEANSFQIPPVQVDIMQNDRVEARKVYMGLVILYGEKRETLPVVQSTTNLEYELTIAIRKLTLAKQPTIGYVTDGGAPTFQQDMRKLQAAMEKTYKVKTVSLAQPVPSDIDILLVIRPTSQIDSRMVAHLDQYLMNGGKLLVAAGRANADLSNGSATRVESELFNWLRGVGMPVEENLVGDSRCGYIMVTQQQGMFMFQNQINYPFFPNAINLNRALPVVKDLQQLDFFFPSGIDTSDGASKGLKVQVIARTTNKAYQQRGRFDINPLTKRTAKDFTEGPFALAAAFSGVFPSYYKSTSVPVDSTGKPIVSDIPKDSKETRCVVVGEGNFLMDGFAQSPGNRAFILNTIDWLAQDESLLEIRTRDATVRPIKEIAPAKRTLIKYGLMLAPVALLVLFGIWRWQSAKRRKVWETEV